MIKDIGTMVALDFKIKDYTNVLLRTPRQHNMYSIDLNNIVPHKNLNCLVTKASADESMLWHRRLGHLNFKTMNKLVRNNLVKGLPSKCFKNDHTCVACLKGKQYKASYKTKTKDETSGILRNFITEIENLKDLKVKIISCDNECEFKNKEMNDFCTKKRIKREFSNARTPQQNRVAERRNKTLIEAARTMLADAKFPVTFWVEAVNTACYVQNRVLVNKSQNKNSYELFNSRTLAIGFLRPFGCHVMILNTLDHLGNFDAKWDEGYFIGYSMYSKAFRVFNKRTKKVEENLHVDFLENKLIEKGAGPNWLFDINTLTNSMNYVPVVVAGTSSTNISAHMESYNSDAQDACNVDVPECSGISNPTATSKIPPADQMESLTVKYEIPTFSLLVLTICLDNSPETLSDSRLISKGVFSQEETPSLDNALTLSNQFEDIIRVEADLCNMESSIPASPTPTFRIHKDHPKSQIIGLVDTHVQTRHKSKEIEEHKPKKIFDALKDPSWVEAMLEELLQFKIQNMDVKSAFLYGIINEEVYVMQPPGFQDPKFLDRVYKVEKKDGVFLSQDKYVGDILKKFGYSDVRSANTPMNKENPRGKDGLDQVTPKECHLYAVKRIFRYLKGHPKLGLWYPKESPFDLVAYSNNDYGGATQDRKSTTGGCQFLGRRLISWQCKKQTIVATSTTKAEYVAATKLLTKPFDVGRFQYLVGEGLAIPTEPHHTPSPYEQHSLHHDPSSPSHLTATTEPIPQTFTETPTKTPTLRQYSRRATQIAQSKALSPAADEPTSLLRDDSQRDAFPTELMELCTSLQRKQTQMAAKIKAQDLEISGLKARVKFFEDKDRGSAKPSGVAAVSVSFVAGVSTVGVPTVTKDKGKEKVVESEVPKKRKLQEQFDAQVAKEIDEEFAIENQRGITLEEIKEKLIPVWKQLEDFVPMSSKKKVKE
uniref:Integrase catalytic domain-containing protein n=1 Tax=Tanacetum cinerariifolium TaxID=118510 RepID=A0A6L2J251_TANCI|nr:hypothetical protein [Tanacetum cinerariifolium]